MSSEDTTTTTTTTTTTKPMDTTNGGGDSSVEFEIIEEEVSASQAQDPVPLVPVVETPAAPLPPPPPAAVMITNVIAFKAAVSDIMELIGSLGAIDTNICNKVIAAKLRTTALVDEYFPRSFSCEDVLKRVKTTLEKRGYTPQNTLFAQSICPDQINHRDCGISKLFREYMGHVFELGGLAGLPFTGRTGFNSFTALVPKNGHCLVLAAPHIGLDLDNNFGKYSHDIRTTKEACAAAVTALAHCAEEDFTPDLSNNPEDYQMHYIIRQVDRVKDIILESDDENTIYADLATQMHRIAKNMLDKMVNVNFGGSNSTLVILTGIQINMPRPFHDFFQPRSFYVMQKDCKRVDLFSEAFG